MSEVKVTRTDDAYAIEIPATNYEKGTVIVVADNQVVHVYQNGVFRAVIGKGRTELNKKNVEGLQAGLFAKTIDNVMLRYYNNTVIRHKVTKQPLKSANGGLLGFYSANLEVLPLFVEQKKFDDFLKQSKLTPDKTGAYVYASNFRQSIIYVAENELAQHYAKLPKDSNYNWWKGGDGKNDTRDERITRDGVKYAVRSMLEKFGIHASVEFLPYGESKLK